MNRRQLLAGLGAAAAGGGAALGTGAFTSVEADRSVNVSVADEDQAYLAIDKAQTQGGNDTENATFVSQNKKNEISIDINDANGVEDPGQGVGLDSVYEFDKVFTIENQGTQEIEVSIEKLAGSDFNPNTSELTVEFYPGTTPGNPLHNNAYTLGTGVSVDIGLKVDTDDPSINDFSADATVSADAT